MNMIALALFWFFFFFFFKKKISNSGVSNEELII